MRKLAVLALLLLVVFASDLSAQQMSAKKSMLLSALVPGLGEYSQGNNVRGTIFLTAEVLTILSYLRLDKEIEWKQRSFEQYANRNAGIPLGSSDSYYRIVGKYQSSDVYNSEWEQYLRNRFIIYENDPEAYAYYREQIFIPEEDSWDWSSSDKFIRYRELRKEKQQMEIYINFSIGAAVLNRLISVIDTAVISKGNQKSSNTLSNLKVIPDPERLGHSLVYEYKF